MAHLLILEDMEDAGLYLVKEAHDVNVTNRKGESPLHLAASKGLTRLAEAILLAGGNPNLQTVFDDRQTPLHLAIKHQHKDVIQAIISVLEEADHISSDSKRIRPNLNIKDSNGLTPLALALAEELNDIATQLLKG